MLVSVTAATMENVALASNHSTAVTTTTAARATNLSDALVARLEIAAKAERNKPAAKEDAENRGAVSYTHLTLPTTSRVVIEGVGGAI